MAVVAMVGASGFAARVSSSIPTRFRAWDAFRKPFIKDKPIYIPEYVEVVIDVTKGSNLKRRPDGSVDFVTPFPCPFNYGSVPSVIASDGDPLDAVVLGDHLPYRHRGTWKVKGMVKFTDDSLVDNKLVCIQPYPRNKVKSPSKADLSAVTQSRTSVQHNGTFSGNTMDDQIEELSFLDLVSLFAFFSVYTIFKVAVNAARGKRGTMSFNGLELYD